MLIKNYSIKLQVKKHTMKKKILSIFTILIITLFLTIPTVYATNPPDPPGEPGGGDEPIGAGAPLSGGSLILIGLAIAYGGKKVYTTGQKSDA